MRTYPGYHSASLPPPFPPPTYDHFPMASTAAVDLHDHRDSAPAPNLQHSSRSGSPQQHSLDSSALNQSASGSQSSSIAPSPVRTTSTNAPGSEHASIHSVMAAANHTPSSIPAPSTSQQPAWPSSSNSSSHHANHLPSGSGVSTSVQRPNKRKLDDTEGDPHNKIRRVVQEHTSQDPNRARPMTTVLCLHAAVAQKSYGSEKRFLCPPPIVHIEGPIWQMKSQQLSMTVVSEGGERSFEQRATLDQNLSASFKFLHVSGTAKSKSFQLSLDIAEPSGQPAVEGGEPVAPGRVWAAFDSAPVTIISKPSKKTAKTRNLSSCILAGGPVSLFNRINSQTVRTKYMTVDQTQLCASNTSWSAFNVNVVRPYGDVPPLAGPQPQPVTYGSEISLSETMSGTQTAPLVIRKVDKGRIVPDDGGPVSQMQKIALQRINPDGTRHYLSAAGPMPTAPGAVPPTSPNLAHQTGTHPLLFQAPRVREEVKDGVRVMTDEVDDFLCWTIVGISKFQYTFFDAFGQGEGVPDMPITPFPTLFTAPVYNQDKQTLDLTVANFFFNNPKDNTATPLDVYLGRLGPLRLRAYQSAHQGPLTSISPFIRIVQNLPYDTHEFSRFGGMVPLNIEDASAPPKVGPVHTIVVVDLPPLTEILRALEEDATMPSASPSNGEQHKSGDKEPVAPPDMRTITGRSLPLLFIRSVDGVGYHSGRAVVADNIFASPDIAGIGGIDPMTGAPNPQFFAAATAAASVPGSTHGWSLRVV